MPAIKYPNDLVAQIVALKETEDLSFAEIGRRLNLSRQTIKDLYERGKKGELKNPEIKGLIQEKKVEIENKVFTLLGGIYEAIKNKLQNPNEIKKEKLSSLITGFAILIDKYTALVNKAGINEEDILEFKEKYERILTAKSPREIEEKEKPEIIEVKEEPQNKEV